LDNKLMMLPTPPSVQNEVIPLGKQKKMSKPKQVSNNNHQRLTTEYSNHKTEDPDFDINFRSAHFNQKSSSLPKMHTANEHIKSSEAELSRDRESSPIRLSNVRGLSNGSRENQKAS
jgi:hypothetical protein